jgi:hypothetical protein
MTLANATVSSGNITVLNATVTNDASISGLTVGKGGGAVSTNTAVGASALATNSSGTRNTALGYVAGNTISTNGTNTFLGAYAGYSYTGSGSVFVGDSAGYNTTGNYNTFIGANNGTAACGSAVTTGTKNTILGGYSGNQNSIDIRTASNNCIVSDGDGNPQIHSNSSSWVGTQWGSIDVTQGAATAGTANSFGITSGTATPIFGGGNYFSGVFIINEFSQTGEVAIIITGGNALKIVSQSGATYVVSSSPTSGQIGIYLSGSVVVVKPGVTGTSNFRIIAFRTRGSQ